MEPALDDIEAIRKGIDEANDFVWRQRAVPDAKYNPAEILAKALYDSIAIGYTYGVARSTLSLGMGAFIVKHDIPLSTKLLNEAHDIFKELNNIEWLSNTLLTQAIIKTSLGEPEEALYSAIKGIEFYEKNHDETKEIAMAYYVTGTVFKDLKRFEEAENYYKKGIQNKEEKNSWTARIYTGLSNIYSSRKDYEGALELALKSLAILKEEKNIIGESRALNDIGGIYRKLKQYDRAIEYLFQALNLRKEANVPHFVLGSLLDIAETYLEMQNNRKALEYFLMAQPIAEETSHSTRLATIYQNIAELYKLTQHYIESIAYFEKYIKHVTEVNQKERESKVNELQNALLQEKEQEIERLRNFELKNAYHLISEKNKEIMDSIHYAKRIQNALLASDNLLKKNLVDQFVLFKPKDIVSGDFYWATENNNRFYLAVCDSTGHGVPGAFMSLLNITFLNEAITEKGILEPHLILNYVRERLISSISQDGAQDGMDGILICIDQQNNTITYAAANNAPVLITGGQILELPTDKMPIGSGISTKSFSLNTINKGVNSQLYLITDGYADQFGGARGKKFKHKQLIELLQLHSDKTLFEQKEILLNKFDDWKGDLEQVDDVCIIGISL